ncbi:flagellar hook-associated 2 domain protein [Planctopirus limnophila DSM 3776]|uniref:Filament cap protein n=2 Tax=Planctopirus limnophila TaxID=120 RepID=D5SXF6_PLAL2|nr:flagellar hook-associated 2 domain protein [Planctopirus limnophila DSM 3776]
MTSRKFESQVLISFQSRGDSVMTGISTGTGLISGIDYSALTDAIINAERAPAARLESRLKNVQSKQAAFTQLSATILNLQTATSKLASASTFRTTSVAVGDPNQLAVTTRSGAQVGSYQFQAIREASFAQTTSRGFANADTQTVGKAGQIKISNPARLNSTTRLELLNGGSGVQRGNIRITDRTGTTATVDLSKAVSIEDVVSALNEASGINISAKIQQDRLVITDLSGGSGSLTIADISGGKTASQLGIATTVSGSTLTGNDLLEVTENFLLSTINDGNGLYQQASLDDLRFTTADGSQVDVNLDGALTIGDVLTRINDDADNAGKISASLVNGRLVLADQTTGAGTLAVANLNSSNAKDVLGLKTTPAGGTLTGSRLAAGLGTVLLKNLNGGTGITAQGTIEVTDRTGKTAQINLSSAETLEDVLLAINSATDSGGNPLAVTASVDSSGTGILLVDTSGSSASPLVVTDVGGGTTAADLKIAGSTTTTSIASGSLKLRSINEATGLSTYSTAGVSVPTGSFRITDSSGGQFIVTVSSTTKTVGDVLSAINQATGGQVTAQLSRSGDGIELVDQAAGSGTLSVAEISGKTATELNLLGSGVVGSDGKQAIDGRRVLTIDVAATDTVNNVISKLNALGGRVRATAINTGSLVSPVKISFSATASGSRGSFLIEDPNNVLGVTDPANGSDAVLRVGNSAASAYFLTSPFNSFNNVATAVDVSIKAVGASPTNVTISRNNAATSQIVSDFVTSYNTVLSTISTLTAFNTATNTRAILQGEASVLRVQESLSSIVNYRNSGATGDIRSLGDLGVTVTTGGQLQIDTAKLNDALAASPESVAAFFTTDGTGVGKQLDNLAKSMTDSIDGSLTTTSKSLEATDTSITGQVKRIDDRLALRRTRLTLQFTQLETVINSLQSQGNALTSFLTQFNNSKSN